MVCGGWNIYHRGLQCLVAIELKTEVSDDEVKARFGNVNEEYRAAIRVEKETLYKGVCGSIPLMAFAVAFPAKESPKKFTYRANLQKLKELTDDLEITDDEKIDVAARRIIY